MTTPRTPRKAHHQPADWLTIHPVGTCVCPRCRPRTSGGGSPTEAPAPATRIELPTEPRRIRVHTEHAHPFDCTLHPDGTLTAVLNGRPHRNLCTFADMLDMGWKNARIELDPTSEPAPAPATVVEQPDLFAT